MEFRLFKAQWTYHTLPVSNDAVTFHGARRRESLPIWFCICDGVLNSMIPTVLRCSPLLPWPSVPVDTQLVAREDVHSIDCACSISITTFRGWRVWGSSTVKLHLLKRFSAVDVEFLCTISDQRIPNIQPTSLARERKH